MTIPTKAQRDLIFKQIGYYPTPAQEPIHDCPNRLRLVAGGERSGKSKSSAADLATRLFFGNLFWLVAQDYERTKMEFTYLQDYLASMNIRFQATKQVDPGEILVLDDTGKGIVFRIATKSAKDPRKLAMEAPDGILVCEASQIDYETYLRLVGRLAEKRGWMLLSGTFESSLGWYVEAFQRGQAQNEEEIKSFSLPTWSNTIIFPGGREDPEIKRLEKTLSREWFMERFGGVPTPPRGLVLNEFRNHIHTGVGGMYDFDPSELVYIFVDPGFASAYAVLAAQIRGEHLYIIDEIYERGFVTSDIIKVAKQKPWWNRVTGGSIDIAGRQHQAMAAPIEVWMKEAGVPLRSTKIRIQDGIERVKSFLTVNPITGVPKVHINACCRGVISEMGGCPDPIDGQTKVYKWRVDSAGNLVGETPDDKHNHGCKALAYGIVDLFGYSPKLKSPGIKFF